VPQSQTILHEKKKALFDKLHKLPRQNDSYGLTHNDIHYGNIFIDDGQLKIFDFDDCSYHWFANDIAIAVHSILPSYDQADDFNSITVYFMTHFMSGYCQENQLGKDWLNRVPDFLRLYDLVSYGIFHQAWDLDNLSEARKQSLNRVKNRIKNETCIVSINFWEFVS